MFNNNNNNQTGYTIAAKHLEQLWDSVDEEVLAGAVLVPLRPNPASASTSSGGNSTAATTGASYPGM